MKSARSMHYSPSGPEILITYRVISHSSGLYASGATAAGLCQLASMITCC